MLLIRGGHVIDPVNETDETADVLIDGAEIVKTGCLSGDPALSVSEVIDADGLLVCPGFVDAHTHFRDPGFPEKETLHTGAQAAAAGGFTTVLCMANTAPAVDRREILTDLMRRGAEECVHILQAASVTMGRAGKVLTDMEDLKEAGAVCFTDDGSPIMDPDLVREAMTRSAALGTVLSFHEEDPSMIGTAGINEGSVSAGMGLKGADRRAEISMTARDLGLALETGCRIDIQHVSAGETVELIRQAKAADSRDLIHAEATPNHFTLTEEAVLRYGTLAKINPPLRTGEDREAILKGIGDGTIDLIATDHAPHTREEKEREFGKAPSGIIGLETAFSLAVRELIQPGILTLPGLIRRMSVNPASLLRLRAGCLTPGFPADLVLLDPLGSTTYRSFRSRSGNSPFLGSTLPGRVVRTIVNGRTVFERS